MIRTFRPIFFTASARSHAISVAVFPAVFFSDGSIRTALLDTVYFQWQAAEFFILQSRNVEIRKPKEKVKSRTPFYAIGRGRRREIKGQKINNRCASLPFYEFSVASGRIYMWSIVSGDLSVCPSICRSTLQLRVFFDCFSCVTFE